MSTRGNKDEPASLFGLRQVLSPLAHGAFAKADQARDAGKFREASEFYLRGLRLKPDHWGARVQLGHALKEIGELDQAMEQYLRALESSPKNADLHVQIGHLCRLRNDNARAAEHYTLAVRLGLEDPHARFFLERLFPPETDLRQQRRVLWLSPDSPTARAESRHLLDVGVNLDVRLLAGEVAASEQFATGDISLIAYDLVIVADDIYLFEEVIRAYQGGCIFRSFGMRDRMTDLIWNLNLRSLVSMRHNVFFALPNQSAIALEEGWIGSRCAIVPRTVAEWPLSTEETAFAVPEQGKVFVRAASAADGADLLRIRRFVDVHFSGGSYLVRDGKANAVDGLDADDLAALGECSAALYPNNERSSIPLFAIELLLLEVPIVYFAGGYLGEHMGPGSPGEAKTIQEAQELCERLSRGDLELRSDILKSQERLRKAYLPDDAWPHFERELVALMARIPILSTERRPGEDEARQLAEVILASLDATRRRQPGFQKHAMQTLYQVVLGMEPGDEDFRRHLLAFQKHGRIDIALRDLLADEDGARPPAPSPLMRWLGRKSIRPEVKMNRALVE